MRKPLYRLLPVALLSAALFGGLTAAPATCVAAESSTSSQHVHRAKETHGDVSLGAQYDTTHVYVAPTDLDAFVNSFIATFGGKASPRGVFTVTPTPSKTISQYVQTPVGMLSVFGFETPIPYPFGNERTGYLVSNMDHAVAAARAAGADVIVDSFDDPIGKDAIVQWPGGLTMQLYWHTKAPQYAPLQSVPDNRVYVSRDAADPFVAKWLRFSHGVIVSDQRQADAAVIGRPGDTIRVIKLHSGFGNMVVFATDGKLPFPYGRETTGYKVDDLAATLVRAQSAGVKVISEPVAIGAGATAMLQFPGGYIAEVHDGA